MINIPDLGEGAKEELPAGDTNLKSTRGTLAHWVLSTLSALTATLLFIINQNYKAQINKLEVKVDKYERVLIPKLNELEPVLNEVENTIDTVTAKAQQNEDHFNTILNKTENANKRLK